MIEAQQEQTKLLTEIATKKPSGQHSTIRIEPKVTWPKLNDDSTEAKDAEKFFNELESIYSLANDGAGIRGSEKLMTLKSNLGGSRLQIYKNIR